MAFKKRFMLHDLQDKEVHIGHIKMISSFHLKSCLSSSYFKDLE